MLAIAVIVLIVLGGLAVAVFDRTPPSQRGRDLSRDEERPSGFGIARRITGRD